MAYSGSAIDAKIFAACILTDLTKLVNCHENYPYGVLCACRRGRTFGGVPKSQAVCFCRRSGAAEINGRRAFGEPLLIPTLADAGQTRMIGQPLMQPATDEPADRDGELSFAHQPAVVHDPGQQAGKPTRRRPRDRCRVGRYPGSSSPPTPRAARKDQGFDQPPPRFDHREPVAAAT